MIHLSPKEGSGVTQCCRRSPFELPRHDRLTLNPTQVTCRAGSKIWWRYAVVRGEELPAHMNGMWFDLDRMESSADGNIYAPSMTYIPTNMWEQRDDGEVAVVYKAERR